MGERVVQQGVQDIGELRSVDRHRCRSVGRQHEGHPLVLRERGEAEVDVRGSCVGGILSFVVERD